MPPEWEITFLVESDDIEHMEALCKLTRQYLEAAMNHITGRHDAKLIDMWLTRKEEPHAANNPAAKGRSGA